MSSSNFVWKVSQGISVIDNMMYIKRMVSGGMRMPAIKKKSRQWLEIFRLCSISCFHTSNTSKAQ